MSVTVQQKTKHHTRFALVSMTFDQLVHAFVQTETLVPAFVHDMEYDIGVTQSSYMAFLRAIVKFNKRFDLDVASSLVVEDADTADYKELAQAYGFSRTGTEGSDGRSECSRIFIFIHARNKRLMNTDEIVAAMFLLEQICHDATMFADFREYVCENYKIKN